ncbi:hypothetical protein ACS0TY_017943 [Phlomoides rotata]
MVEEFQESDVVFQENVDYEDAARNYSRESRIGRGRRRKLMAGNKSSSVPVSIPVNASRNNCVECDYGGDDGEMLPPHVIVGRRIAGKMMALSICTGKGTVLKGRELRDFRNLVLRVTGFLET